MCKIKFIYFLLIVFSYIVVDDCFNLDTINYVKYSGTRGTMFGFSVATHKDKGQPWILIGAPADDSRQRGVYQGGAVYRCDVRRDDHCTPLPFDSNGNLNDSSGRQIDQKSHQWFGATVHSGGADKPIVACAPRYVWFSTSLQRRDPVGTCFLSKSDFTDFHEYSPCRTKNWGYHRQGACQAGFSAAVSKDGERLFISAPGSWYWQGQMYSLDPTVHHPYRYRFGEYGATGQAYAQNLQERPSVLSTKEGQSSDDDSYMGYSLAVGDFTGDGMSGAAIGMPRGNTKNKKLVGKIVLYTWNLTNHQNISGEQLGAYFGYSIAAADVDGDKLDDLIIGAPLYTTPNNEGKYEVGRIYVRYQRNKEFNGRFQKLHTRDGVNSRGRFGLAVASLGDLDLDGYGDIGVGAPYDGPGERGVVYIFYGSSEGLREKPSQVIRAEQVNQMSLYTFGFSISGNNIDLDNNQYPDIIVGSYLSDTAVVFKTRAVIKLTSSILFSTSNKVISLDEKLCSLRNRERVTCTDIKSCFHYNGTGVNRNIDLNIQYILDAKNMKDPRMFFLNQERISTMNQTRRLESHVLNCVSTKVYIKDNIRDKLTPLEVEMRYSLKDENLNAYRERSTQYVLPPILDQNVPSVYKDKITIRKNCGSDDICIPNLRLITQPNVEKYLLGSNKRLSVDVMVQNHGEDSFESVFYMKLPKGVNYFKFERIDDSSIPVQCSAPSAATNNTLKCDIGNPLPAERMVHFKVLLDPYHEEGMAPSYDFEMGVNSTNPELGETTGDNTRFLSINIWVETNISLTGWAQSAEIFYNTTTYDFENYTSESEIGPQVVHFYSLKNNGPSLINQATAMFMWPDKTLAGDDLMYLLEQPELSGSIKCDFAYPNPLKVTLDRKKSYLETIGITPNEDDVNYGALSSTGSVSYGSSSHIDTHLSGHRKTEEDRKIEESGDGSYVHINRGKELSKAEMEGARGGTRTYVSQSSWNTSSQNGSPVVTHSWNKTTVTGSDGVTRETSYHSTGGGTGLEGSQGSKAKIFYTSSRGNAEQQSGSQQGGNQFSISGQDSGDQFSTSSRFGQTQAGSEGTSHSTSSHGTSSHGTSSHGTSSQGSTYRETSHRGSHETSHGTFSQGAHGSSQGAHGSSQGAHGSSQGAHGSSQGFSQGAHGSSYGSSSHGSSSHGSSSHSSHGIVVSTQRTVSSTSRTYDTSGEETLHHGGGSRGPFDWNGAGGDRQGSRQYEREEHSRTVYQGSNEIGREEARRHGVSGYGTSGHEVSGHGTSGHGVSGHGASGHGASGHGASGHGVSSHGVSSHEVFTHGVSTHGASGQGVSGHGTSSHGISSHGTSSHGTSSHGISGQGASGHGGGAQGSFHQSGTRHNGTHQITWTAEGSRDYDTSGGEAGIKFYNTFVTEESVNQGINDYTQEVLTHGRQHGHRQEDHHSQGHRQEDRHSQGHRQETHNQGRQYGASQETHHNQGRQYGASQETHHNQGRQHGSQESHHSGSGRDRSTYGKYNQSSYDASLGLGGAAIGGGFRTTTLDLGVGTNTNVDENISGNDDEYDYSSEVHYDPDLGSYEDRSHGQGRSGVSYGSSRTASGERNYGNQHGSQGRGQSSHHYESHSRTYESHGGTNGGGRSYESHSSRQYTGDNVPTEYPLRHRNKRSTDEDLLVKCKATQCRALRCVTGPIKKDEEAWVALRFRVNAQTLKKIVSKDSMDLSSMMTARIDKLPYIGTPKDEERTIHSHEVFTKLTPTDTEAKVDVIPLWIVVLSACAGAIILLLLAFLLYKCGFFKRNRPSDAPERQPLNRNGYHGDEQL